VLTALEPVLDSEAGITAVVGELGLLLLSPVDDATDGEALPESTAVPLDGDAVLRDGRDDGVAPPAPASVLLDGDGLLEGEPAGPVCWLAVVPVYGERGPWPSLLLRPGKPLYEELEPPPLAGDPDVTPAPLFVSPVWEAAGEEGGPAG
jgi:hypothetical protein